MREPENRKVEYSGYEKPLTIEELNIEILGLKNAIKIAEQKIAFLEQSKYLAEVAINKKASSIEEVFGGSDGSNIGKNSKTKGNREVY
jgi:hypothetical protein